MWNKFSTSPMYLKKILKARKLRSEKLERMIDARHVRRFFCISETRNSITHHLTIIYVHVWHLSFFSISHFSTRVLFWARQEQKMGRFASVVLLYIRNGGALITVSPFRFIPIGSVKTEKQDNLLCTILLKGRFSESTNNPQKIFGENNVSP